MADPESMAFGSDDGSETEIVRQSVESNQKDKLNLSALDKALAAEMGSVILDDDVKLGKADDSQEESKDHKPNVSLQPS